MKADIPSRRSQCTEIRGYMQMFLFSNTKHTNLKKATGKTQTMKKTELKTSILVRAISRGDTLPLDDVLARHAAA